jgi:hypothetical protein
VIAAVRAAAVAAARVEVAAAAAVAKAAAAPVAGFLEVEEDEGWWSGSSKWSMSAGSILLATPALLGKEIPS